MTDGVEVVDNEAVDRLRMLGGDEFVSEAMGLFVDSARVQLGTARDAVASGDIEILARICHTLRGSSGNVGASLVFQSSALAEQAARNGDPELVADLVDQLQTDFDDFVAELTRRAILPPK